MNRRSTTVSRWWSLLLLLASLPLGCNAWHPSTGRITGFSISEHRPLTRLYETTSTITNDSTIMATPAAAANALKRVVVGKLRPETTAMLLCDVQERFRPLMYHGETVIQTCQYLTSVAHLLHMPIVATQQYTKVFGPAIAECFASDDIQSSTPVFEKKKFSMLTPEVTEHLQSASLKDRTSFLLFGIETHVCVQQTALDLLEQGNEVHIIVDGVTSQQALDRQVALTRLQQVGAYLTTAQSAVFMLMQSADHPNFKAVSQLTVAHMKKVNEFNQDAIVTTTPNAHL